MLHLLISLTRVVLPIHHFTQIVLLYCHLVYQVLSLALELELLAHIWVHWHMWVCHASRIHCKVRTCNLGVVLVDILLYHMKWLKLESLCFLWLHAGNLSDMVILDVLVADLLEDFPWEFTD